MEITYTYDNINWIIFMIGIVIILHMLTLKKSKERTIKFANYETLEKAMGKRILHKNYVPLILRILAVLAMMLALSDLTITVVRPISNVDFVLAIDTSQTMLSSDNGNFTPNRLESAKLAAYKVLREAPEETDLGIVTFAGMSYIKAQLSKNRRELRDVLKDVSPEGPGGTAIGDAIVSSASMLGNSTEKQKVIVLLTDGSSNRGVSLNESINYANQYNIKIYAIGVGVKNNSINNFPTKFNLSKYNLEGFEENDFFNTSYFSTPELDEEALIEIANRTNGQYIYVKNDTEMELAFRDAILKANTVEVNFVKWAIISAIFFLLIEWALGVTRYKTIP